MKFTLLNELRDGLVSFTEFEAANRTKVERMAVYGATRWRPWSLDIADLYQEAMIVAWRAVDSWDPSKAAFDAYVSYRVGARICDVCRTSLGGSTAVKKETPQRPIPGIYSPDALFSSNTTSPLTVLEIESVLETLEPMVRDVAVGMMHGERCTDIATAMYADEARRKAYSLASPQRTWHRCRVHMQAVPSALSSAL